MENGLIRTADPDRASSSAAQIISGTRWDHLSRIENPETNLAILRRPVLPIASAVDELLESDFESFQVSIAKDEDPVLLGCYLEEDLGLKSIEAGNLYLDLVDNLRNFFAVSGANEIGIQLEAIRTDMCALFHYDLLRLRLVCTYAGPGTEWLRNEDVNRNGLLRGNNELVLKTGAVVQSLPLHHVGLMKGERYHEEPDRSLIHRSPSISGRNIARLFLRMDTLD